MQTKLKLNLEDLTVDSFDTTRPANKQGTVFGEQCTCYTQCTCPGCPTCDASCNGTCGGTCANTCDDNTCVNCSDDTELCSPFTYGAECPSRTCNVCNTFLDTSCC
ncbi:MAG TPA: hypothetical protein VE871_05505 [Longimicrobium sp.]|nr:hypothetical protein [Longimicrobium sp.]